MATLRHTRGLPNRLRNRAALASATVLLSACALTTQAHADEPTASETTDDGHRLQWTFPRFRLAEYVAAGAVTAGNFTLESVYTNVPDRNWTGGILWDSAVRNALRSRSYDTRRSVSDVSDVFWNVTQYYPVVVDGLFIPLVTDRLNFDVAFQMTLLNWQAQSLTFLMTRVAHRTVGRMRPEVQECGDDPKYTGACDPEAPGRSASFLSGHASMTFAGAALICAHHSALPLYGGNAADVGICVAGLASATTVGVMRIVADAHWSTDVIAGAALGTSIGYGLPHLLHYGQGKKSGFFGVLPPNTGLVPLASPSLTGIAVVGLF